MSAPPPLDPMLVDIAGRIAAEGGRLLLVGGSVRDRLLGIPHKDYDVEVYGLPLGRLEVVLATLGEVVAVGRSFGVLRVKGLEWEFSIPRRDSRTGRGHRGFIVELDPTLEFAEAARRRDLTINSMGLDPRSGEILDPHGGRDDLERGILRATDPATFPEDSLRALRVAQFRARFEMEPDETLRELCARIDLSDLPPERILRELEKLLLKGRRPSLGLEFLRETGLLRFLPELDALVGVPQDAIWHPEGSVWEHTLRVVDEAARTRTGDDEGDLVVLLGALCHDLGKPAVTERSGGRIRSPRHEEVGAGIAGHFLERLRVPQRTVRRVLALVRHHLAPSQLVEHSATPKAYRRLARKLEKAEVDARLLLRLAEADHFGRTTREALGRSFPAGAEFLRRMEALSIEARGEPDVVLGRHLIARGYEPSPWFGKALEACREVQYERGWRNPDRILDEVLSRLPPPSEGPERNQAESPS